MKKSIFLCGCALAALLCGTFTSCQKEGQQKRMTFTANMEGSNSKTALAYAITWSEGDQINVFPQTTAEAFTLTSGAGTLHGTFSGTATEGAETYYAVYPYNASTTEDNGLFYGVTVPETQQAVNGGFDPAANVMVAKSTSASTLNFKNVCAFIHFTTDFDFQSVKIYGIDLYGDFVTLAGAVNINYSVNNPTIDAYVQPAQCVELNSTGEANPSTNVSAGSYMIGVLPNTNLSTVIFEFVTLHHGSQYRRISVTQQLARGRLIDFGIFTAASDSWETNIWATTDAASLSGLFSVSATQQVQFSRGNLQYRPGTETWRFAPNQYDMVGSANTWESGYNYVWKDLFSWSTTNSLYGTGYYSSDYNFSNTFSDWGELVFGSSSAWRTLTIDEWNYLLYQRTNADQKWTLGRILLDEDLLTWVKGLIIAPDNQTLSVPETNRYSYVHPTYSLSQWSEMESQGFIFLPAAGTRDEFGGVSSQSYYGFNTHGAYWSASAHTVTGQSRYLFFYGDNGSTAGYISATDQWGHYRSNAHSVRLVKNYSSAK